MLLETAIQDVRHAFRSLRKSPAFAVTAIVTLTLGVAATTVVFSVVDSILLNPIPFKEADRLVEIYTYGKTGGGPMQPAAMLPRWRDQKQIFDQVEAHWEGSFALSGPPEPEVIYGSQLTAGLLSLLGVQAQVGRIFAADESEARVALISEELWKGRFGADSNIIGKSLRLTDDVFTIVGVMPSWFKFPVANVHVWIPFDPSKPNPLSGRAAVTPIARLRQGVPLEQADAQVAALAHQLNPSLANTPTTTARLRPMNPYAPNSFLAHLRNIRNTRTVLYLILGAAALVLLASCANSANLFLLRASSRGRELAVRAAVGGSRFRLTRYILTEALIIATIAGTFGMVIAAWTLRGIETLMPLNLIERSLRSMDLDSRAAIVALVSSVVAGLIAATIPALSAVRGDLTLRLRAQSEIGSLRNIRFRGFLIALETMLALLLVVGGGLTARTLWKLLNADPGWSPEGFVVVHPEFRGSRYASRASREDVMSQLATQFRATPGVDEIAIADTIPLLPMGFSWGTLESGDTKIPDFFVSLSRVTPSYFKTLGVPLIAGRSFESAEAPQSVIITREMADKLWPGASPLGKQFRLGDTLDWSTVVGVVGRVQSFSFDSSINSHEIYRPLIAGSTPSQMQYIALKTNGRVNSLSALRSQIRQVDPDLTVEIRTIDDIYQETLAQPLFQATLFVGFALLTVLLAVAGVYAVVAYEANQRTKEIGIRVALGATRAEVIAQVMRRAILPAAVGVVLGLTGGAMLTKFMSSMLYGIKPTDAGTFVASGLILLAATGIAGFLPARKASHVDPMVALRTE